MRSGPPANWPPVIPTTCTPASGSSVCTSSSRGASCCRGSMPVRRCCSSCPGSGRCPRTPLSTAPSTPPSSSVLSSTSSTLYRVFTSSTSPVSIARSCWWTACNPSTPAPPALATCSRPSPASWRASPTARATGGAGCSPRASTSCCLWRARRITSRRSSTGPWYPCCSTW